MSFPREDPERAEGFEDGDSIVLYEAATREALDTIIVSGGKFSYEGEADSVVLKSLMALDGSAYALFFNEAGTIQVTLSKNDVSRISGTKANDAWQAMADKEAEIEGEAEDLLAQLQDDETDEDKRAEVLEQYNKLQEDMSDYLRKLAEDNIDNENLLEFLSACKYEVISRRDRQTQEQKTEPLEKWNYWLNDDIQFPVNVIETITSQGKTSVDL